MIVHFLIKAFIFFYLEDLFYSCLIIKPNNLVEGRFRRVNFNCEPQCRVSLVFRQEYRGCRLCVERVLLLKLLLIYLFLSRSLNFLDVLEDYFLL